MNLRTPARGSKVEGFIELLYLFPTRPVARFEVPANVPGRVASYQHVEEVALAVREAWHCRG